MGAGEHSCARTGHAAPLTQTEPQRTRMHLGVFVIYAQEANSPKKNPTNHAFIHCVTAAPLPTLVNLARGDVTP